MEARRTVTVAHAEEFMDKVTDLDLFDRTVGYLTRWGIQNPRFCNVYITTDCRWGPEIHASYRDKEGNITFHMAAILDETTGKYSFHS